MTRSFRRDHDHIEVGARHNLVVMDRETVSEGQSSALLQVRLQLVLVQLALELIRGQNHNQISRSDGAGDIGHFQAMGFGLGNRRGAAAQTNSNVHTGIFQVAGVGVTLGTVTDDGNFLALDDRQVTVFIVENFHEFPLFTWPLRPFAKGLDAQHFVATGNPGDATAYGFQDRGSADRLNEAVQLVARAG